MTTDEAASTVGPLPFDTTKAHQARMYDYLLGGTDNYAADRAAADEALKVYPEWAFTARANRAFLGRVVRYLAGEVGIPRRGWSTWTTTDASRVVHTARGLGRCLRPGQTLAGP